MAYLDTSILGSYYCPEPLSGAVNAALSSLREAMISPLVEVEFCSLLAMKVRRSAMNVADATAALAQFKLQRSEGFYCEVGIGPRSYEVAQQWLTGFSTALRTLDALHLATAFVHDQELLTTDRTLAAAAEQLRVRHRLIG